jgi:hypothetical protein
MKAHWRSLASDHSGSTTRLWVAVAALAGMVLLYVSWVQAHRKGSEMNKPGFDSPEGEPRGQEDAALPYARAAAVQQKNEARLMAMDGVEGVGMGRTALGDEAIVVYVRDEHVTPHLPKELDGVAVQVQITGRIEAQKRK